MTRFAMNRLRNKAPVFQKDLFRLFAKDGLAARLVKSTTVKRLFRQVKNHQLLGGLRAIRSLVISMSSSGWRTSDGNSPPAKPTNQKSMPVPNHGTSRTCSKTFSFGVRLSLRQL